MPGTFTSNDLCLPIYLNQQVVFDMLAVLDDGFSTLSTIRTAASESDNRTSGLGASIGASNVFALLGVTFSGNRNTEKSSQDQTEVSREKIHTPTSLFAKLRISLREHGLIQDVSAGTDVIDLCSGQIIEFKAILRKNPLEETLERLNQLIEMAENFQNAAPTSGTAKRKAPIPQTAKDIVVLKRQLTGMLSALNEPNSVELIGELLDAPDVTSVLTARPDFFSEGGQSEIIDGEFSILGKITRVVVKDSGEPINLLRKTAFGKFHSSVFEQLSNVSAAMETAGMRSRDIVTEIPGPALLVIPIAIFT